jgi:hypothetical protein
MKRVVLPVLLFATLTMPVSAREYTPAMGTAERAEIMDAIRGGSGATSVFVVDYLRVERGRGVGVAYAEVHPQHPSAQRPYTGWFLLTDTGQGWEARFGVGSDGANNCAVLASVYRGATAVATAGGASPALFSRRFQTDYADLKAHGPDLGCVGDILINRDNG